MCFLVTCMNYQSWTLLWIPWFFVFVPSRLSWMAASHVTVQPASAAFHISKAVCQATMEAYHFGPISSKSWYLELIAQLCWFVTLRSSPLFKFYLNWLLQLCFWTEHFKWYVLSPGFFFLLEKGKLIFLGWPHMFLVEWTCNWSTVTPC